MLIAVRGTPCGPLDGIQKRAMTSEWKPLQGVGEVLRSTHILSLRDSVPLDEPWSGLHQASFIMRSATRRPLLEACVILLILRSTAHFTFAERRCTRRGRWLGSTDSTPVSGRETEGRLVAIETAKPTGSFSLLPRSWGCFFQFEKGGVTPRTGKQTPTTLSHGHSEAR